MVIGHAKLEESDLKPVSQVVSFQNNLFDGSEMKMLQVGVYKLPQNIKLLPMPNLNKLP